MLAVLLFAGSVTPRIETVNTENQALVLVILERASLVFFFVIFILMNYICLCRDFIYFSHSNWITLKMSERLRQGGRFKRKGASSIHLV